MDIPASLFDQATQFAEAIAAEIVPATAKVYELKNQIRSLREQEFSAERKLENLICAQQTTKELLLKNEQ